MIKREFMVGYEKEAQKCRIENMEVDCFGVDVDRDVAGPNSWAIPAP